ncbi:hypothetical protein B0T26DRAFT_736001 [Lasiosphaeria miniovina]|uniref:Uncharacterized protein n=1 Tax=Lasiosphaeria miniovina TaxID=1954250 RepID=A0AA40DFF9_9PEZI|nr:uncharacterized protein B0T26DRAFT_736001 [Lasiosphaeria miniovina]KAK0701090.1 hypothetical protein B0T26DRAFT_736001 [Lasiosphaeria miniovina]
MVGIGGGVPSGKNDIRLGDVVVIRLGKNTDDGFVMKGFLWPPPEILRSAVGIMRSDYRVSHNKIPEFLSAMFQKSDDVRVSYQRPVEPDELFQLEYRHVPNQATCQLCDKTKRVQRPLREPTPKIHYGLIAYGDQHYAAAAAAGCAKGLLSYVDLPQPSTTTAAVGQHGFDSSMGNRPAAQHIFRGQGVQNPGSGNVSIGKDLNIGRIDSW